MNCGNLKIDLGCGPQKKEGYVGVDIAEAYIDKYPEGEYVLCDFELGVLPFCTNSAIKLYAHSVLEHIQYLIPFMNECHRILKPEGDFFIVVPRAGSEGDFKDPTHVRHFHAKTFTYFKEGTRQVNYGIKPWKVEYLNHTDVEGSGRLEVSMVPVK